MLGTQTDSDESIDGGLTVRLGKILNALGNLIKNYLVLPKF